MPRISIDNYDTIASWNGSEDLFVIEQPDGTKVATPAMVKQFIEAGDFEATGEVKDGHGNILADMAKSADVDAEIGDLSQTGLTGDSVAEQLDTAREQIAELNNITSYTVSDISGLHSSMTINEFSIRKCGKIVTLSMNFSVSASIPVFTVLATLPSAVKSYSRVSANGVFTNKTLQADLAVTADGTLMANTSIDTGSYYVGQIVYIMP